MAHEGEVRCGKCGDVFDANQHLYEVEDSSASTPQNKESEPFSNTGNIEEPFPQTNVEPAVRLSDSPIEQAESESEQAPPSEMPDEMQPASSLTDQPSRTTGALSPWAIRSTIMLLVIAALGQTVYFLRTEITAKLPQSRPLLGQVCSITGCTVKLPQHANLLSIDDTDLQEDPERQGVYIFTCNLINSASFPQAYPLLELTLTDLYGKAVLRRTLDPDDYLPQNISPETGLTASSEARLKILFEARNIKATGYRIYVTYP